MPIEPLLDHVRRLASPFDDATDGDLVGRFVDARDGAALAALVRRHGPTVWGVCRRLLANHDAEDAFQATFLVFVRKAATVSPRDAVGRWLYGVAHRTAMLARRTAARRVSREQRAAVAEAVAAADTDASDLHAEVARLPGIYREVVTLCDLDGRTRAEAARVLGVPEGTVAGRLARARELLSRRLAGRSVAPAVLTMTIIAADVSAAVSPQAVALCEGVILAMTTSKLKAALAAVLLLAALATGATALVGGAAPPEVPGDAKGTAKVEKEPEPFTAWGKASGGLQAGIGLAKGTKRSFKLGETITVVVRVRNVSDKAVEFEYVAQYLDENPPTVTDAAGKVPEQHRTSMLGMHGPTKVRLEPGKEVVLRSRLHSDKGQPYGLGAKGSAIRTAERWHVLITGTGKVTLRYPRVFGNSSVGWPAIAAAHRDLATGTMEIEVGEAEKE